MSKLTRIPHSSKIADLAKGLKDPVEYVRKVLAALVRNGARIDRDDYMVGISLQGDLAAPDYRIVEIMDLDTGQGATIAAYSGRTHKELSYEKVDSILWSAESSTFREVQELIGELRSEEKAAR